MRHRKRKNRLSRPSAHRQAMLNNLVSSLFLEEKVKTTLPKAKEAKRVAERLITLGKKDDLGARRAAFRILSDHRLVKLLFDEIAPLFKERKGGYTRIIPANFRAGDGAPLAFLELLERREKVIPAKPEKKAKPEKPRLAEPEEKKPKEVKPPKPKKTKPPKPEEKPRGWLSRIKGFFKK